MLDSNCHLRSLQKCFSAKSKHLTLEELASEIKQLRKDVNDLKIKTSKSRTQNGKSKAVSNRNCYKCGSRYHLQADCPENHAEKYKHIIKRREQQDKRVNTNRKDRLARNLFKRL